ncbi:MAG: hypothetical protein AABX85_03490 [Nanoarchaeota archaeon]
MILGTCKNCKKEKENIVQSGKSEGLCKICYKKLIWKPKVVICARCKRDLPMHAKGLCTGCYASTFHSDIIKIHNAKNYHKIDSDLYKKIIKKCIICNFDKIIEIHHLDHNHQNNFPQNLVGLCPNCHKLLHSQKYQKEIFNNLKAKGFNVPESSYSDGFFNKK